MKKIQKIKCKKMVSVLSKLENLSDTWKFNTALEIYHEYKEGDSWLVHILSQRILSNEGLFQLESSI